MTWYFFLLRTSSVHRTPGAGGDQTPVDIGDQTPGLLVASDPFDAVVAEIPQPVPAEPEVVEIKPRLYTSVAHVMGRHPNELSLQLAEMVEVSCHTVLLLLVVGGLVASTGCEVCEVSLAWV